MKRFYELRLLLLPAFLLFLISGCTAPDVKDDFKNTSFQLVNQKGEQVTFPDDFNDSYTLVGYIYTHCPDICPMIISNMKKIQKQVEREVDKPVKFVGISFDPERDDPRQLRKYFDAHELNSPEWTFLTGDTTTVDSLMNRMGIFTEVSYSSVTGAGEEVYFITHTDRISLFDTQGRLRQNYRGSSTPPELFIEDLNAL